MPEPSDLYVAHAETIELALAHAGRLHRLAPDAADEFASWARVRLLDNDQAILRKFQGRSSLRTFLVTVVQRLFLDWRNAEWGKWRPTASARRVGPVAIELERLVGRDNLSFEEAVETLRSRRWASRAECEAAWAQLPRRPRRRRVDESDLAALPSASRASDGVDEIESRAESARVTEALEGAIGSLPSSDQVLLRLRYWSGFTVARIAHMTGEDQKLLYRRFERMTAQLRRSLAALDVSPAVAAEYTSIFDDAPDGPRPAGAETAAYRPSIPSSTGGEHV